MRLISQNKDLEQTLKRLISTYPNCAIAVAWASSKTAVFDLLSKKAAAITRAVIGTHFYQTHPDVLTTFVDATNVRCVLQPDGVFHPKLYVFWSEDDWEVLIGSANLTSGALSQNSEAMLLIRGADMPDSALKSESLKLIDQYWVEAAPITGPIATAYRELWLRNERLLRRLAGRYGAALPTKPPVLSSVMSMSWKQYFASVKSDRYHGFEHRCDLLQTIREAFIEHSSFSSIDEGLRKTIAGLPNRKDSRWAWFGSMTGAGYFKQAIARNDPYIASALDRVPINGFVTRQDYDAFIKELLRAFPKGGAGIAVPTRLLAMKRPDQFVCLDSKNLRDLCKNFGIPHSKLDYGRYWSDIVERICDAPWWNAAKPSSSAEKRVFDGRAAMLDAIFYHQ